MEGILEKLKIAPQPRNPDIRPDKPVMVGGPLAEDRGLFCTRRRLIFLQHPYLRQHGDYHLTRRAETRYR